MPVSEAQARARDKWDRENLTVLQTKLRKEEAQTFRQLCQDNGVSVSGCLHSFITEYIAAHSKTGNSSDSSVVIR